MLSFTHLLAVACTVAIGMLSVFTIYRFGGGTGLSGPAASSLSLRVTDRPTNSGRSILKWPSGLLRAGCAACCCADLSSGQGW
jgi:hypothetical protein